LFAHGGGKNRIGHGTGKCFGGEIISADSLQVYRYLDIGTAKPSKRAKKKKLNII